MKIKYKANFLIELEIKEPVDKDRILQLIKEKCYHYSPTDILIREGINASGSVEYKEEYWSRKENNIEVYSDSGELIEII